MDAHAHIPLEKRHGFLRAALGGEDELTSSGVWRAGCSWWTFLTQNTHRSLPHHAVITAWSPRSCSGKQLPPSIKGWRAGKSGKIVCKARSQENHMAFYTCSQFWYYLLLCDKRIDFQKLPQQKQCNPVFSPDLPGSLFHNSSDHKFLLALPWFCNNKLYVVKMSSRVASTALSKISAGGDFNICV